MDWISYTNAGMSFIKKNRYALLIIAAGLLLMLPKQETTPKSSVPSVQVSQSELTLEESLARVLGLVEGAGRVEVLLTLSRGEETIFQNDTDLSTSEQNSDQRSDTVLITGEDRAQTGLIRQINPPEYRGAIIVCEGADRPEVRLSIVEAVMRVTGLTSDKITVLKMK